MWSSPPLNIKPCHLSLDYCICNTFFCVRKQKHVLAFCRMKPASLIVAFLWLSKLEFEQLRDLAKCQNVRNMFFSVKDFTWYDSKCKNLLRPKVSAHTDCLPLNLQIWTFSFQWNYAQQPLWTPCSLQCTAEFMSNIFVRSLVMW